MNIRKLTETLNKMIKEDNIESNSNKQLSFVDDVHNIYAKVKEFTKNEAQKLIDDLQYTDAVDLYDVCYEFLNKVHKISGQVSSISDTYRRAKQDLSEHPEDLDKINEWYGRFINNYIIELNAKLDELQK